MIAAPHPLPRIEAKGGWKPRGLPLLRSRACKAIDLAGLGLACLWPLLWPAWRNSGSGFGSLLDLRVPVRSLIVAVLCVATWHVVFATIGVYAPARNRSFIAYALRLLVGLSSAAAVVGLVQIVLLQPGAVWRVMAQFWLLGLASLVLIRTTLIAIDKLESWSAQKSAGDQRERHAKRLRVTK